MHPLDTLLKLLTVLGLAVLEIWAAIPAGLALGLPPLTVGIVAAIGSIVGAMGVVLLGERVRAWIVRRRGPIGPGVRGQGSGGRLTPAS